MLYCTNNAKEGKNMKKILTVLLTLFILSALAVGVSAADDAKTRLYNAANDACPSTYRTYYMGIAYNILGQIDVSDTQADQIIAIIDANVSSFVDKGPSLDTYSAEEIKLAVDLFDQTCSILGITYDMRRVTDASHVGDDEFVLYYNGTWIATIDGDDFTTPSKPSSGGTVLPSYKVEFKTDGGSKVTTVRVKKNTKIDEPAIPTKEGYVFGGWYTDEACTVEFDFNTPITAKTTLYAKWTPEEPVTPVEPTEPTKPDHDKWTNPYNDVSEDAWYYDAVKYVSEAGIMNGIGTSTFAPDGTLTRAMFVTMLYRMEGSPKVASASDFNDVVSGAWYESAINWAAANKIVKGISTTEFAPDIFVTREQMVAIIYRYAQYKGVSVVTASEHLHFDDADTISEYAVSAMNWAVGLGIINGYDNNNIAPRNGSTRAQAATVLMRMSACV